MTEFKSATQTTPVRPMKIEGRKTRLGGAAAGILVFLVGIALIGYVFLQARDLFESPVPIIPATAFAAPAPAASGVATTVSSSAASTASASPATGIIVQSLTQFVTKLLILLLMCIAGSVIASKGIDLFFKTIAAPRHPEPPAIGGPTVGPGVGPTTGPTP